MITQDGFGHGRPRSTPTPTVLPRILQLSARLVSHGRRTDRHGHALEAEIVAAKGVTARRGGPAWRTARIGAVGSAAERRGRCVSRARTQGRRVAARIKSSRLIVSAR